jgi:hypothetical protein
MNHRGYVAEAVVPLVPHENLLPQLAIRARETWPDAVKDGPRRPFEDPDQKIRGQIVVLGEQSIDVHLSIERPEIFRCPG